MANYIKNLNKECVIGVGLVLLWFAMIDKFGEIIHISGGVAMLAMFYIWVGITKIRDENKNIIVSTSGKEAIGMSSNSLKLAPFLAHGAGCSYEKALNKNNENIMDKK